MKAITVFPGKPNTVQLTEVNKPSLDQIPNGRGVLVKVLRVGVDGTDKEINAAEYGTSDTKVLGGSRLWVPKSPNSSRVITLWRQSADRAKVFMT
jgi:hypothetical protein